jgi:hypothetical protein
MPMKSDSLKLFWIKLTHFEFWPWKVFYAPLLPYYLYLSAKNKSIAFPSVVNTALKDGGFFQENKAEILRNLSSTYLPKTVEVRKKQELEEIIFALNEFEFPLVAKPLSGQRGNGVQKLQSIDNLHDYHSATKEDYVLQEFVELPIELAIFYSRLPHEKTGVVSSVTQKEFLSVKGDGISNIESLLMKNYRAKLIWEDLRKNLQINWQEVLPAGKVKIVEPIGNHCRGTIFRDARQYDFKKIAFVCDKILKNFEGFNYGRFDLKTSSIEDFYLGKNIKIVELNGVNADAAHIFDPNHKLFSAYSSVLWHWKRLSSIAKINQRKGFQPISSSKLRQNIFKS